MRVSRLPFLLAAVLPLAAQAPAAGNWFLDVHSVTGALTGHYHGTQGGQPFQVDLQNDLDLASTGNKLGVGMEYQGPRFGLELSMDTQTYRGSNPSNGNVVIDGETFGSGGGVTSRVKAITSVLNWTIRYLTFPESWLGIDLGVRDVAMTIEATGPLASGAGGFVPDLDGSVTWKGSVPLPMVGLSGGLDLLDNTLVMRAYVHTLEYSGASYNVAGADLRYFPTLHAGLRVFTNVSRLKIPSGSIKRDIDLALGQNASGLGVVVRF